MPEDPILLTGATGFVGRCVLTALLRRDYRVRCLVRSPDSARLPDDPRIELAAGDILDTDSLAPAARRCRAAIHLVGIIRETPAATFDAVHVDGTRHLLDVCRSAGVTRFIHMSAAGRLAHSAARYQQTKARAEELVRASGLAWTIFRPSLILGPGGEFLRQMVDLVSPRWRPVPVIGSGQYAVQPVGVDEVADLFARSLDTPAAERKIYPLGGPSPVTFDVFLDTLSRVLCGRTRCKLHLPLCLVRPAVALAERLLAAPPITREQLCMLLEAEPVDTSAARADFQWTPLPLETVLRMALDSNRR